MNSEKFPDVRFSVVRSPYRSIVNPVSRYVDRVSKNAKQHNYTTTVLIPEFVPNRTWKRSLHNQTALRLRFRLSYRDDIIISTYNYHLKNRKLSKVGCPNCMDTLLFMLKNYIS